MPSDTRRDSLIQAKQESMPCNLVALMAQLDIPRMVITARNNYDSFLYALMRSAGLKALHQYKV